MKSKKILFYSIVPVLAGVTIIGATQASANGLFGFGKNATPQEIASRHTEMFQEWANFLGISIDDVKNAWAQGKTMQELAAEKGITKEQLQTKMKEARLTQMKTQLQALVDQGVITQSQADQRLSFMQSNQDKGPGKGGRGGRGGMGFGF